jgi:hypothetical protein
MTLRTVALLALVAGGCAEPMYTEMLGKSIATFTSQWREGEVKVWIANQSDSECDRGCAAGQACGAKDGGGAKVPGLGGLFGGGGGASAHDKLAWEVFTNYLTAKRKAKVLESHRHNYALELGGETRTKMEMTGAEPGKNVSMMSCEDLCLLDEAKKRHADKVLAYRILSMSANELEINLRYSDVKSGQVEQARTIKIRDMVAIDHSFGGAAAAGASRRAASEE